MKINTNKIVFNDVSGNVVDAEASVLTPMQEVDLALKECSFGLFHIGLLTSAFFGVLGGTFITNATPYILPNAECDLNMDLLQKGILNAVPFVGMLVSSVVAGFLIDTFGRKKFLVFGNGGIFFFTLVSSLSQTYEMLVVGKFFEGIFFATAHSACTTMTAEFSHKDIRDRMMLFQNSYKSFGQIFSSLLSWAVLVQDWRITLFNGSIVLNTWNFYLMIISMLSFTACVLYSFQPESLKFLVSQKRFDEARETLKKVYTINSGKSARTFKYADIWKDLQKSETLEDQPKKSLFVQLLTGFKNIKPMFRRPLLTKLVILCLLNTLTMAMYNVIRLWFPQLSTIVEHYDGKDGNHELCGMLDAYTKDLRMRTANMSFNENSVCEPTRSGSETYINSIILGFICLTPLMISGALVNTLGKKLLMLISGGLTIAITLWLRWAKSKTEVVGLFATDMAIGATMMGLLQASAIEIFPTTSRTLAIGIMMTMGRIGSLAGNVLFPILLDMGCVVPFYTITGLMIAVTFTSLLLPKKT